jgi:vacuolar-type H+-ATPase subunit I/STV1
MTKTISFKIEDDKYAEMVKAGINPNELFDYVVSQMLANTKGTNWYYATRLPYLKDKIKALEKSIKNARNTVMELDNQIKNETIELINYTHQVEILEEKFEKDRVSTRLCNLIELLNDRIIGLNYDIELVRETQYDILDQIYELDESFDLIFHVKLLDDIREQCNTNGK